MDLPKPTFTHTNTHTYTHTHTQTHTHTNTHTHTHTPLTHLLCCSPTRKQSDNDSDTDLYEGAYNQDDLETEICCAIL